MGAANVEKGSCEITASAREFAAWHDENRTALRYTAADLELSQRDKVYYPLPGNAATVDIRVVAICVRRKRCRQRLAIRLRSATTGVANLTCERRWETCDLSLSGHRFEDKRVEQLVSHPDHRSAFTHVPAPFAPENRMTTEEPSRAGTPRRRFRRGTIPQSPGAEEDPR